jgi:hypothetical protein
VILHLCRPILFAGIAVFLSGCTTISDMFADSCEQFEQRRKQTNYATDYQLESAKLPANVKPLAKNDMAAARSYQLSLNTERPRPCSYVKINKELVLVRRDNPGVIFEETREFFAADGTRIAVKTETLTEQLRQSGRYAASVPLPIPKNTPSGKYRLVSTLTLKFRGAAKPVALATAAASFEVMASKK